MQAQSESAEFGKSQDWEVLRELCKVDKREPQIVFLASSADFTAFLMRTSPHESIAFLFFGKGEGRSASLL